MLSASQTAKLKKFIKARKREKPKREKAEETENQVFYFKKLPRA